MVLFSPLKLLTIRLIFSLQPYEGSDEDDDEDEDEQEDLKCRKEL